MQQNQISKNRLSIFYHDQKPKVNVSLSPIAVSPALIVTLVLGSHSHQITSSSQGHIEKQTIICTLSDIRTLRAVG